MLLPKISDLFDLERTNAKTLFLDTDAPYKRREQKHHSSWVVLFYFYKYIVFLKDPCYNYFINTQQAKDEL